MLDPITLVHHPTGWTEAYASVCDRIGDEFLHTQRFMDYSPAECRELFRAGLKGKRLRLSAECPHHG